MSKKNLDIVYQGWLIKSPPEKKILKTISLKLVSHNDLNYYFYIYLNFEQLIRSLKLKRWVPRFLNAILLFRDLTCYLILIAGILTNKYIAFGVTCFSF